MCARVLVTRNGSLESVHTVAVSIVAPSGEVVFEAGDFASPVFLRSLAKPLVAAAMLAEGVADQLKWIPEDIALIAGSHHGEARHVRAVRNLLQKQGFTESALLCGAQAPKDSSSAHWLIQARRPFTAVHNNCSGQHAGILGFASRFESKLPYIDIRHPAYHGINAFLSIALDCDLAKIPWGVDGCSLVTFAAPLRSIARAFAQFTNANAVGRDAHALERVRSAMIAHPLMVGGETSIDSALMAANPQILSKLGAEAVYGAAIVSAGVGIAVKVVDGNVRALFPIIREILQWAGALDHTTSRALEPFLDQTRNAAGIPVGSIVAEPLNLSNGLYNSPVASASEFQVSDI